jgi:predicted acylesterase/phospholipase RssA
MSKAELHALNLLAGCSQGSTISALVASGCKPATLDRLVRAGLLSRRVARMANPRNLIVIWYQITAEGEHARDEEISAVR